MLAFIIAIKHPERSNSYDRVTDLLRQTLASVEAQTDRNFVTVVVCNELPTWANFSKDRLFVQVDFPPAELPSTLSDPHSWSYLDKGAKNAVGLLHAKQFNPTHAMFVDGDDFVSRHLAQHVHENPDAPGWYFESGLMYSGQFKIAEVRDRFWSYCGSSHILRSDLLPVPKLGLTPSISTVLDAMDGFYVERILGCHLDYASYLEQRGLKLAPLPFIGAVWHTDTGENSSRLRWGYSRFGPVWGKPLPLDQLDEFSIPPSRRSYRDSATLYGWRARSIVSRLVRFVGS